MIESELEMTSAGAVTEEGAVREGHGRSKEGKSIKKKSKIFRVISNNQKYNLCKNLTSKRNREK
jgi:hypothetical protein